MKDFSGFVLRTVVFQRKKDSNNSKKYDSVLEKAQGRYSNIV